MNAARDLAAEWRLLQPRGDEAWNRHLIVSAIARAIDGPRPEPFHKIKSSATAVGS
jgi:hypothetical protein